MQRCRPVVCPSGTCGGVGNECVKQTLGMHRPCGGAEFPRSVIRQQKGNRRVEACVTFHGLNLSCEERGKENEHRPCEAFCGLAELSVCSFTVGGKLKGNRPGRYPLANQSLELSPGATALARGIFPVPPQKLVRESNCGRISERCAQPQGPLFKDRFSEFLELKRTDDRTETPFRTGSYG